MGDTREKHKSYGMVGFSRCNGTVNLFGSHIPHTEFITLSIREATVQRSLHREWYSGDSTPIIEVRMSAVQFASLLTTMNVGDGVPCTIVGERGVHHENPPAIKSEKATIQKEFKDDLQRIGARLNAAMKMLEQPLATKSQREALKSEIQMAKQDIAANIPFLVDSFDKNTSKVIADAKAEVDACVTGAIQRTGLENLRKLSTITEGEALCPKP